MTSFGGRGRPPKKPNKLALQRLTAVLSQGQGDSNHPAYQSKQSLSATLPINEEEVQECLQPRTLKRKRGRPGKFDKKEELLVEKEEMKRPKVRVTRILTAPADPDATDSSSDEDDDKQRWVTRNEVPIQEIRIPVHRCSSKKKNEKKRKLSESGKPVFHDVVRRRRKRSRRAIKRTVAVPSNSSPLSGFEVPGRIPDFVQLNMDPRFSIYFFADVPED